MTGHGRWRAALVALVVGACSAGTSPDVTAVRDPESVAAGVALFEANCARFEANCARCHGSDLEGGPAEGGGIAPALIAKTGPSDVVLIETVKRGRGFRMPAFATQLEESEIASIIDYVRSRQAARLESQG